MRHAAVVLAMAYPETRQGKRSTSSATKEISGARLSMARSVLRFGREEGAMLGFNHVFALSQWRARWRVN
jgi:hypothetical protein